MIDNIALWYVARSTGLVALLLITATLVTGILGSTRAGPSGWPRFVMTTLHRNVSLLTLAFLAVHVTSSVIDRYAGIGWLDAVLPFGSVYKPTWLGLGAIAFDLLLALMITSLLRPRINARLWRAVHWIAYVCWPVALAHALGIGTDARGGWPLIVTVGCLATVAIAAVYRLVVAGGAAVRPAAPADPARRRA
jgi:methionine sulfoxide reductase heme-binding subunit